MQSSMQKNSMRQKSVLQKITDYTESEAHIDTNSLEDHSEILISPLDLENFLPWASKQMEIHIPVVTKKIDQEEYVNANEKKVKKKSAVEYKYDDKNEVSKNEVARDTFVFTKDKNQEEIVVVLTYEGKDVVRMGIEKTKYIPRKLIALITTIVKFHPCLQSITIGTGLDQYIIYELSKLLPVSNVTEIYLDNTFIAEANYDILLNEISQLQVLSLARCKIDDKIVKNIAAQLYHPLPASSKLCVLNLSSNRLTDCSCIYLSEALRFNRKLTYLNMAGNTITDNGGKAILNVLLPFRVTIEETLAYRKRYLEYLKHRNDIMRLCSEKQLKMKKTVHNKKGKIHSKSSSEPLLANKNEGGGDFTDPMTDFTIINGIRYCNGNNTLTYLNLSYNSVYYPFLEILLKVLIYQYTKERKMKGLIAVLLQGNPLPINCEEYRHLDQFFEMGISINVSTSSTMTKIRKNKVFNK